MGRWSPETHRCEWVEGDGPVVGSPHTPAGAAATTSCEWVEGDGPVVGARFKGYNRRGRARWSNTVEVIAAERGRELAFRRAVLHCGVCEWRYVLERDGRGTLLTESYEVTKPDWAITNWFNGVLLRVEDRDLDLIAGMHTTVARIKSEAEATAPTALPDADHRVDQDESGARR